MPGKHTGRHSSEEKEKSTMALTRKFLTAMGIEPEKIDQIIEAHAETVSALKEQVSTAETETAKYKADAEKLPGVQKELDDLKASTKDNEAYKEKYDKEHADFEAYKSDIAGKETKAKKTEAYKALLKEAGISEKHIEAVLKASADKVDAVEFDDKGAVKDAKKATEAIKTEWSDFITTTVTEGAHTATPPTGGGNNSHHGTGRAAQIAAQYQASHYGTAPGAQNSTGNTNGSGAGTQQ